MFDLKVIKKQENMKWQFKEDHTLGKDIKPLELEIYPRIEEKNKNSEQKLSMKN